MFMLKLLLEVLALAFLTLFIRKALTSFFIWRSQSAGYARLQSEWQTYSTVFIVLGLILSIISFWIIYGLFSILHSIGQYSGIMVVSQAALIIPSIIFGFLGSSVFARSLYTDVLGFPGAIFEEGKTSRSLVLLKKFFSTVCLILGIALLSMQFGVYLKTDGENIYVRNFGEAEKVYAVEDIQRVSSGSANDMEIYLANGERLSTGNYSGNLNYFLDHISR